MRIRKISFRKGWTANSARSNFKWQNRWGRDRLFYFQLSVHVIHDFPQFNLFDPPRKLKSASIPHYNKDERTKNSFLRNWRTISPDQVKLVLLLSLTTYFWSELTWAFLPQPDRYQFSYKSVKKMKLYKKIYHVYLK